MQTVVYKEKQAFVMVWISCLAAIIIVFIAGFGMYTNDEFEKIPFIIICIIFLLFNALILMFYKMSIRLSLTHLEVKFGIGVFKINFNLKDIDIDSIATDKPSKWYGIGWRYKLNGDLILNTKFGKSVCFNLHGSEKTYHIVTSNFKDLEKYLIKACRETQKSNIE